MTEDLHDFLSCHHLLDEAVDMGEALLLGAEECTGALAKLGGGDHHHYRHQDAHQCQGDAHDDHGGEGGDDGDEGREDLCHRRGYHLSQGVDIIGIDGHDVSMGTLVKIADGQSLHLLEDDLTEAEHRALAHMDHQTVIGIGADGTEEQDES